MAKLKLQEHTKGNDKAVDTLKGLAIKLNMKYELMKFFKIWTCRNRTDKYNYRQ